VLAVAALRSVSGKELSQQSRSFFVIVQTRTYFLLLLLIDNSGLERIWLLLD
jgi:hypothetical protein